MWSATTGLSFTNKPSPQRSDAPVLRQPTVTESRRNRLKDAKIRRAAAATNTSLYIAKAQQRAALRAAAQRRKQRAVRKEWNSSPLSKLCDEDERRTAAIEKRIQKMHPERNGKYDHRIDGESEDELIEARQHIRIAKATRLPRSPSPPPRTPQSRSSSPSRDSTNAEGRPRSSVGRVEAPSRQAAYHAHYTTRPTSPFDERLTARALGVFATEVVGSGRCESFAENVALRGEDDRSNTFEWGQPPKEDLVGQRKSLSAIEDVGTMARAVAGLVGSASRAMELHEDRQRKEIDKYNQLAAFQTWQARAQRQLDASLRLQQQQLAATLADWRSANAPHFHFRGSPPPPPPFSGTAMPPVRSDAELVEKLWEKISEIEDDERRLSTARKFPSGASPPEGASSISLPLGVVASLIQDKGPEEKVKPPRAESVDSKPSRTAKFGDFFIDATVPPDVCRRVEKHRDAVRRYRGLVEADLFGSDMTQTQIVDQLADELVDLLLSDVANEVGSIIDDCSETILVTA